MIKIINLNVPLDYNDETLFDIVSERLGISADIIKKIEVDKRLPVTADKNNIHFKMTVFVDVTQDESKILSHNRHKFISKAEKFQYVVPAKKLAKRPVIIGCGPAGIFAALILAEAGTEPILLERGPDADSRTQKVMDFWHTGVLDLNANVQYGEGGAGAFSDGKLKVGQKDNIKNKILNEFVEAGACEQIKILGKPHIGTDRLNKIVKVLRNKTISLGGEVLFNAKMTDVIHKNGQITGVGYIKDDKYSEIMTDNVILAIGHSARDTFKHLAAGGVYMEQKPISIGVRIEHPQKLIDKIQYADFAGHPRLGAADYKMVVHLKNGRAVYTFCMCPGGSVVAATSDADCIVTNGMSRFGRDGENANSALLVTLNKNEINRSAADKIYPEENVFAATDFQKNIERAAFIAAGGNYKAPVQKLEDFLNRKNSASFGDVLPSYLPGTEFVPFDSFLPEYITDSLRQAIYEMEDWMPGFLYPDAVLTGAETRSSSPIRIKRDESLQAVGIKGLYPCGEGAGYSGGIISAAVDGILCAEKILGIDLNRV